MTHPAQSGTERVELPPCFKPKLLVCPHCLYMGSAAPEFRSGYCWACAKPIGRGDENIHVFGPEERVESFEETWGPAPHIHDGRDDL